ncbi:MAG: 3-hydroxyacyl-CoA dehydrogenase/enoyl-CoA hydratase family protein [Alphaproteobacteria bacterium]|jgi:enoyl-CoA hydratase / 3-hydroxyacyl-CoA dehydrogenase|nr:3-hydroxyacyl-CoA dehydrogenase/enoyl-CoA hydratase family protein [Alphaproteobacteria bacterium]MBT4019645.1 3-hydroxyacyl-CoA dehydrogenase/enoyl-CoA hydratase family protein [Alphaproteobacteria bacterium]MBT4967086.1 3-hydroxyacyl-CoA dehydrogenase/enoyl-CoA hydratase family protein [Alphaproteobacteria bacterium]MBT5161796.1 3-hydroxyacyl-CoA dehydrogenase/enoyl-CoA hydratase family protein [Alphaproteobacteria bacterium]
MTIRDINFDNPALLSPTRALPTSVAIIGAGTIGPDIGYYLKSALPDLELVLIDINETALEKALSRIENYVEKGLARKKLSPAIADKVKSNIVTSTDYQALAHCDWVLEAATENLDLKKKIFSDVEALVSADALITSNTSSLPAERLFSHLQHPARATVTHFFAPAFKNPAVEVVEWAKSDEDVIDYLRWFFYQTGKVPLVTDDAVCFMLDRVFDNWCNEAALLLDVATPAEIDSVTTEFVHAGPFFVLNMANGNPIIVETNTLQMEEEGEHYRPADIFNTIDERWETIPPGAGMEVDANKAKTIRDRMLGILFSQTVDILDRNIGDAADLDLGCVLALGFKKGPIELMKEMGEAEVQRIMAEFAAWKSGMPQPQNAIAGYWNYLRYVLVSEVDDTLVITLRRPEAMNALHDDMTNEILNVIQANEGRDDIKGFVITGYGTQAFCAGADIGRFPTMLGDKQQSIEYSRDCSKLLVHLDQMNKPVVAALNGLALGGGLELATRCHALIGVSSAWMQLPEITLGIVPGIGAMVIPYRRWPEAADTFHGMLLKAEKLTATQAVEIGMLHSLVEDPAKLIQSAAIIVKTLAADGSHIANSPVQISAMPTDVTQSATGQVLSQQIVGIISKAVVDAAAAPSLNEALETGYAAFGDSACTAAAKEGISAFGERRKPDFATTG